MWSKAFDRGMRRFVRIGALEITFHDGTTRRYGDPDAEPVRATFHDPDLPRKLLLTPDLAAGEAYMDGRLTVAQDAIGDFLRIAVQNRYAENEPWLARAGRNIAAPWQRFIAHNRLAAARANVKHHYDLSGELYDLFLDEDRQYSCAYFTRDDMTLEEAQEAKKHHVARKLALREGDRVLDIGCGWGGLALTLAQDYGAQVVGVTLSDEQHDVARRRVDDAGLADRIDIRVQDYRKVGGPFDRIVSVGMFEHVGAPHFREYFRHVRDLLTEDGVALIHTIGTQTLPRATSAWIRKYIFPGGYLPALSEMSRAIEAERLTITDIEVLRLHYARTVAHWRQRFDANLDRARDLFDERFCRMWRYYLHAAELGFSEERLAVFQIQLARHKSAVPTTRDYLYGTA